MKKFRLFSLLAVALCFSATGAFAQLSTGRSSASVVKMGNRPSSGDWGIYVGATSTFVMDFANPNFKAEGLPLINVKYYADSNLEYRVGLQLNGSSDKLSGDLKVTDDEIVDFKYKNGESSKLIIPGFAYHFNNHNLLDVYAGAELPIGCKSYVTISEEDDVYTKSSRSPFTIGLGGFIGLQAFVADLPLSIGLEYGISYSKQFGDKTKTLVDSPSGEQTFYSYDGLQGQFKGQSFDKLSVSKMNYNNDVRLTITYYFKAN